MRTAAHQPDPGASILALVQDAAGEGAEMKRRLRKIRTIIARAWGTDNDLVPQIDAALESGTQAELKKAIELVWLAELSRRDISDIARA